MMAASIPHPELLLPESPARFTIISTDVSTDVSTDRERTSGQERMTRTCEKIWQPFILPEDGQADKNG